MLTNAPHNPHNRKGGSLWLGKKGWLQAEWELDGGVRLVGDPLRVQPPPLLALQTILI